MSACSSRTLGYLHLRETAHDSLPYSHLFLCNELLGAIFRPEAVTGTGIKTQTPTGVNRIYLKLVRPSQENDCKLPDHSLSSSKTFFFVTLDSEMCLGSKSRPLLRLTHIYFYSCYELMNVCVSSKLIY